jgi:hypothetical protein
MVCQMVALMDTSMATSLAAMMASWKVTRTVEYWELSLVG